MSKLEKYSENEIEILKEGGKRLATILNFLADKCVAGISAKELDNLAEEKVLACGDIPVFKNYRPAGAEYPFPASLCVSINEVVAHGIPGEQILKEGDVVSLDLGLRHQGLVVDAAVSVLVGGGASALERAAAHFAAEEKLISVTKKALEIGIEKCRVGNFVGDIGVAIEKYVRSENLQVVDVLWGHAVGREIHSAPNIPHVDTGSKGEKILEGMVLAIEPHISMGNGQIKLSKKDSWSLLATDGAKSAQFEHTVLVTDSDPLILTKI